MRKYLEANVIYDTSKITRSQWLKLRQKGIGGSDASSVLGLNPYKSKVSVYMSKVCEEVDEDCGNYRMELGQKLEDFVAKEFSLRTGKKVRNINGILKNGKYPFAIANIDKAIVAENAFLECKVTNSFSKKEWSMGVPIHYQIQCFHYMAVTGATHCYVCVLIGNEELIIHTLDRDEEIIEDIMSDEERFWNKYILEKEIPLPDGSSDYTSFLKERYKRDNGESIILFMQEDKLKSFDEIVENTKKLEKEKRLIEQSIQKEMGECEVAYVGDRKVTWKTHSRNTFDTKKFKVDYPELYVKYLKNSTTRLFKIN